MNKKKAEKYDTDMQRVKDKDMPDAWGELPERKEKEDCDACSG